MLCNLYFMYSRCFFASLEQLMYYNYNHFPRDHLPVLIHLEVTQSIHETSLSIMDNDKPLIVCNQKADAKMANAGGIGFFLHLLGNYLHVRVVMSTPCAYTMVAD